MTSLKKEIKKERKLRHTKHDRSTTAAAAAFDPLWCNSGKQQQNVNLALLGSD
jgi:hypothetical protein